MTLSEAYAAFAARPPEGRASLGVTPATVADGLDMWPCTCTALALLSGLLDICEDDADLDAAVKAGRRGVLAQESLHLIVVHFAARVYRENVGPLNVTYP